MILKIKIKVDIQSLGIGDFVYLLILLKDMEKEHCFSIAVLFFVFIYR